MNNEENNLIKDLMTNKDTYLDLAGDQREKLKTAYRSLESAHSTYGSRLMHEALSRAGYVKALNEKKIDPYIAGGAASAIGGAGLGLSAGVSSAARNQKIDNLREHYSEKVNNDSLNTKTEERALLREAEKVKKIIDSIDDIKDYKAKKAEEEIEKRYQEAKRRMNNGSNDTKLAYNTFLSLGNYKDSAELAENCQSIIKKKKNKVVRFALIACLCIAAFVIALTTTKAVKIGNAKKEYQTLLDEKMSRMSESEDAKRYGLSKLEYEITDFRKVKDPFGKTYFVVGVEVHCFGSSGDLLAWKIADAVPGQRGFTDVYASSGEKFTVVDEDYKSPTWGETLTTVYVNGKCKIYPKRK